MAKNNIYIFNEDWFESTALCNPIEVFDNKLKNLYPDYYTIDYDLRLLVTEKNKKADMFNDYKQKYGTKNINDMKDYVTKIDSQMVLLNNFDQDHFDYILGYIKNVKVL